MTGADHFVSSVQLCFGFYALASSASSLLQRSVCGCHIVRPKRITIPDFVRLELNRGKPVERENM